MKDVLELGTQYNIPDIIDRLKKTEPRLYQIVDMYSALIIRILKGIGEKKNPRQRTKLYKELISALILLSLLLPKRGLIKLHEIVDKVDGVAEDLIYN